MRHYSDLQSPVPIAPLERLPRLKMICNLALLPTYALSYVTGPSEVSPR